MPYEYFLSLSLLSYILSMHTLVLAMHTSSIDSTPVPEPFFSMHTS